MYKIQSKYALSPIWGTMSPPWSFWTSRNFWTQWTSGFLDSFSPRLTPKGKRMWERRTYCSCEGRQVANGPDVDDLIEQGVIRAEVEQVGQCKSVHWLFPMLSDELLRLKEWVKCESYIGRGGSQLDSWVSKPHQPIRWTWPVEHSMLGLPKH